MEQLSKRGGLRSNSGANRNGSGPVYDIATALGISQAEMAAALGMSVSAIQKLEREGRAPRNTLAVAVLRQMAWRIDAGEKRTAILEVLE